MKFDIRVYKRKNELLYFVRHLYVQDVSVAEISRQVRRTFKLKVHIKTIHNYISLAFREERIKKYEEENKLMDKWQEKESDIIIEETNYAENLSSLFEGKIAPKEFEERVREVRI